MTRNQQLSSPGPGSAFQAVEIPRTGVTLRLHQAAVKSLLAVVRRNTDSDLRERGTGLLLGRAGEGALTVWDFEPAEGYPEARAAADNWRSELGRRMWAIGLVSFHTIEDNRRRRDFLQRAHALLNVDPAIALQIGITPGQRPKAIVWILTGERPTGTENSTEFFLDFDDADPVATPDLPDIPRIATAPSAPRFPSEPARTENKHPLLPQPAWLRRLAAALLVAGSLIAGWQARVWWYRAPAPRVTKAAKRAAGGLNLAVRRSADGLLITWTSTHLQARYATGRLLIARKEGQHTIALDPQALHFGQTVFHSPDATEVTLEVSTPERHILETVPVPTRQ